MFDYRYGLDGPRVENL